MKTESTWPVNVGDNKGHEFMFLRAWPHNRKTSRKKNFGDNICRPIYDDENHWACQGKFNKDLHEEMETTLAISSVEKWGRHISGVFLNWKRMGSLLKSS